MASNNGVPRDLQRKSGKEFPDHKDFGFIVGLYRPGVDHLFLFAFIIVNSQTFSSLAGKSSVLRNAMNYLLIGGNT